MVGTALARLCPPYKPLLIVTLRDGSRRRLGIIRVHPVHSLGRQRKQHLQHAVADPGSRGAELALAVAVAAGERDDLLGAGPPLRLELLEGYTKLAPVLHQAA